MSRQKALRLFSAFVLLATPCLAAQQQKSPAKKPKLAPITASNYQWTTYKNGWAELSFSLRNNTKSEVQKVKYRVIFYRRNGEPIHFEDGDVLGGIPPGLAVQETKTIMEGGLNLYHSTAKLRVEIISYDGGE